MESLVPITGGCFCGSVTYQVNGLLRNAKSCHCSDCRKAFNAQASAAAFVEHQEFEWRTGSEHLTTYVGSHGYGVQFCKICGSTLCTVYKDRVLQLTLGCVNGEPDIGTLQHIFVGSKAHWEVMPEGISQFDEWPLEGG